MIICFSLIFSFLHSFYFFRGEAEVSDRDIQINSEQCSSKVCEDSCENTVSKINYVYLFLNNLYSFHFSIMSKKFDGIALHYLNVSL